ncbi:MAG: hypothetical protein KGM97_03980 [Alphaproteobacteria bacterium]|nr:hypothetical protein [Alphaproteobacteria bacterium]MDE2630131.1 hypothetical protein [Alphaproteobacteria bacterium]
MSFDALKSAAAALLCAGLLAGAARADVTAFYGNWENAGRDASGVAHVQISPAGGNHVGIRIYGDCHPIECNWGLADAQSYTADPRSGEVTSISANFNSGFARKQIIIRKGASGGLQFEMLTDFIDGSGRHNFDMTGALKHTAWAGPLGQGWENNASQHTGWGGGVRSGASQKPRETCDAFDDAAARAVQAGTSWKVVAGNETLVVDGAAEGDALRALATIRHYRFDRRCRVGAVPLTYWKRGTQMASGRMGGADCIAFNPTTAHAAHIGHRWRVVDGVQWIADSGDDKTQADSVLSLIRFYHLDAECFVGRPNPIMVYWLSY